MPDSREFLDRIIKERGETYAAVSRLLGRNSAYIQQFIKRGSPTQLDDSDIAQLSVHFDVPGSFLGGEDLPDATGLSSIAVPVIYSSSSDADFLRIRLVDAAWLKRTCGRPAEVSIVIIEGDAMHPTLNDGDEAYVHRMRPNSSLQDGLYAIRTESGLQIRRIALEPKRGRITVMTDNPVYPTWRGILRKELQIVGRVVWLGAAV